MNTPPRPKAEPFPVLLNASDAMLFAAEQLEKDIANLELISILADVLGKAPAASCPSGEAEGRKTQDDLRVLASGIVDKELQVAAMRAAAKEIRAMAHETELAEARASARGSY